ncbi:Glycosyl transferase, group 1 [Croceibacter atlanticus HTCC2559]|uniref:Glycosyl transferase, group 1 n=1 Tax=Croceibacter atlanticus (strain ATCC BAA-628 / JCM 21780 / CIP 108009 / IAM 15332 / KCTC 12090 / HTCC2559) TaxID=216432 RepID=A3U612_CROAH|nr:Glycosyl transferase, group 1 [Croceibacter atlanticus HTCC2559]
MPNSPSFIKRILHILDFSFGSLINSFKIKSTDLVISIIPVTPSAGIGWLLKKRLNAKLWVHIQDFEFDAALQSGLTTKKKFSLKTPLFGLLFKVESWLLNKADITSTISNTMLEKLSAKTKSPTYFLPNWVDNEKIDKTYKKPHKYFSSNKFKILYSGNIGDKQDWDTFVQYASKLDKQRYELIVIGDGSKKAWLKENTKTLPQVSHYEPVPYEDLGHVLSSAQLHILFQKTEIVDTVMPSKILGMMGSSVPSLVTGSSLSEVKKTIQESEGGKYVDEAEFSINALLTYTECLFNDESYSQKIGENAKCYIISKFSKNVILKEMESRIATLLK